MTATEVTRQNMLEKLAWMKRSVERMRANLANPTDVQDHFLSFVHASHLLFFYFCGWVENSGSTVGAKALVRRYVSSLKSKEAEVWECLKELRTGDVHISPVRIANTENPGVVMIDGYEILIDGQKLLVGEHIYVVECAGISFDVLELCDIGLEVKNHFCNEFDSIQNELD